MVETIARHRTALVRSDLSRPVRLALHDGLISESTRVLDYGCGRGGDVRRLADRGISVEGWDPVHRPHGFRKPAEVVNLGYVVNVIEDPEERETVLRSAWALAERVLIVAARLEAEARSAIGITHLDGYVTRRGTFQKLYQQHELQDWIDTALGANRSVSAGPGVFYVFRDEAERQSYLAARCRRPTTIRVDRAAELYDRHRTILDPLLAFLADRGRVPLSDEVSGADAIQSAFGSLARAFQVLRKVVGDLEWERAERRRTEDMLVFLALSRFTRRPRFSELSSDLRADVRAFFTSYQAACELADALLFAVGNIAEIDRACRAASVGKCTPAALYVHQSALAALGPELRIYEGCARNYIGSVEGANVIKLNRLIPQVSYLAYPQFDRDPHPSLARATVVPLQTFRVDFRDYGMSKNPPILHRKEEFVETAYPLRGKFARLTKAEEAAGLFSDPQRIGTREGWEAVLAAKRVVLRGHRVVSAS